MNNLIDERDERTRKRKKIKRKMDSIIGLSSSNLIDTETGEVMNTLKLSVGVTKMADSTIRLLDEGYFDSGFVIKKGTLEKYLNGENQYVRGYEMTEDGWQMTDVLNLNDDFTGTVNIGHMEFATYPIIVGEWTKKDLSLVDIENDRKAIDVVLRLNEELNVVQDLKMMPYDIGISAEFYYHVNEDDTETLSEMLGYYMPVIDEVFIFAYGLVGECGNVNSSGLELKGAVMPKDIEKELMAEQEVDIKVEVENADEVSEEIEAITEELGVEEIEIEPTDEGKEAEEVTEDAEDAVVENSADDADEEEVIELAEEEEPDEEDEVEEAQDEEEDQDEEDEIEEADELTEALSIISDLNKQIAELTNKLAEKDKKIRRLSKKIAVEKEAKAKFLEETKNLSVELLPNELEAEKAKADEIANAEETRDYVLTGGIADI